MLELARILSLVLATLPLAAVGAYIAIKAIKASRYSRGYTAAATAIEPATDSRYYIGRVS